MLNIITSNGLSNVLVVVTRYFGGILLGTGGLVRAYSEATIKALNSTIFIDKDLGVEAEFDISYSDLQKLKYYFEKNNIKIINNEFNENVKVIFEITKEKLQKMLDNQINLSFKILKFKVIQNKYIEVLL
ncbi:MAG: DUF1949 domain-containing protein [Clostridia bacterium]|nr:DUF1949 domain-containing protein [Clostridia bacterium]